MVFVVVEQVILVCFVTYTLSSDKNVLDAEKTFVSIAISNSMYFALGAFSHVMGLSVQASADMNIIVPRTYIVEQKGMFTTTHMHRKDIYRFQ